MSFGPKGGGPPTIVPASWNSFIKLRMDKIINSGDNNISTKNLSNGIYILIVETKEGIIRKYNIGK